MYQGRRKQSPDGRAQSDVSGEAVNNSRGKNLHVGTFSSEEALSLHFSFNWDSKAWKFSHTERKSYACALRYVPCRLLLQQIETTQMSNV